VAVKPDVLEAICGTHAGTQTLVLRLVTAALLLLLLLLAHAGIELRRQWFPPPAYIVSLAGAGWVEAGVVSDRSVLDFATSCTEARFSFLPSTYAVMQERFQQCLHPVLAQRTRVESEQEGLAVRKGQMATQLTITERRVLRRDGARMTVHLRGLRGRTLGETRLPEEAVQVTATLLPWPEQGLPTQLVFTTFEVTPKLSAGGPS
jgi:hypothetical protein